MENMSLFVDVYWWSSWSAIFLPNVVSRSQTKIIPAKIIPMWRIRRPEILQSSTNQMTTLKLLNCFQFCVPYASDVESKVSGRYIWDKFKPNNTNNYTAVSYVPTFSGFKESTWKNWEARNSSQPYFDISVTPPVCYWFDKHIVPPQTLNTNCLSRWIVYLVPCRLMALF